MIRIKRELLYPFLIFSCFFILFCFLVAGTFGDVIFAEHIFRGDTAFTVIFDILGKVPGFLAFGFAAGVLSRCVNRDRQKSTVLLYLAYVALCFCGHFFVGYSVTERIENSLLRFAVAGVIGIALTVANIGLIRMLPREKAKTLEKWSIMILAIVGCVVILTAGLKLVWGRVRFNQLDFAHSQYSPWYKPSFGGIGDSFPSGHTALAAVIATLPFLLSLLQVKKWKITLSVVFSAFFIVSVPISRMIGGYHFLSDVVISLALTFAIYLASYLLLFHKRGVYFAGTAKLSRLLRLGPEKSPKAADSDAPAASPSSTQK